MIFSSGKLAVDDITNYTWQRTEVGMENKKLLLSILSSNKLIFIPWMFQSNSTDPFVYLYKYMTVC